MRKLIVYCFILQLLVSGCSLLKKGTNEIGLDYYNSYVVRTVDAFERIPDRLLVNLNKTGFDNSPILNQYESDYLNYIFGIESDDRNLFDKRVYFLKGKEYFFNSEFALYKKGAKSGVGGMVLYFFSEKQKNDCGGYDVAIDCWSYFILTNKKVVRIIKRNEK